MEENMDFEPTAEDFAEDFTEKAGAQEDWPDKWEQEKEESFSLSHQGKSRDYSRGETLSLAEKGLKYQELLRENQSLKPRLSGLEGLLSALKRRSGMDEELTRIQ